MTHLAITSILARDLVAKQFADRIEPRRATRRRPDGPRGSASDPERSSQ
jgi:hypothetical protein